MVPSGVAPDIIKPDVTAPGVNVLAGNTPTPVGFSQPEQGAPGSAVPSQSAGTSMSSPHVAGLFALLKQAHPDWTPAMAELGPHDDLLPGRRHEGRRCHGG